MKRLALAALAFAGLAWSALILAAAVDNYVLVWSGSGPSWAKLGTGLTLQGSVLSAATPAVRAYDVKLTWDSAGVGWRFPNTSGPKAVSCTVNGLRYHSGEDFQITSSLLVPNIAGGGNWPMSPPDGYSVVCDYEP